MIDVLLEPVVIEVDVAVYRPLHLHAQSVNINQIQTKTHAKPSRPTPKLVTRGLPQEASSCELPPDMAAMAAERWVV